MTVKLLEKNFMIHNLETKKQLQVEMVKYFTSLTMPQKESMEKKGHLIIRQKQITKIH